MTHWKLRKIPTALKSGDRIIFSSGMGGENQVVTVDMVTESFGTAEIHTDELDFPILVTTTNTVKFA